MSDYTTKAHLEAHHEASAAYHAEMAKCEMSKAKCEEDIADAHDELEQFELGKLHKAKAKIHKLAASHHEAEAERHGEMRKQAATIKKSMSSAMAENRGFEGIRGLVPGHRPVIAVPRVGQRELGKAEVPVELEHIVSDVDL